MFDLLLKIIKFGLVGLLGMAIDFGITWLVKEKLGWNKYLANVCGFSVAVVNNYLINKYWTFNSAGEWKTEFSKFLLFSVIGLLLNTMFLYYFHQKWKLNFYLSKAIAIVIVFVWNFSANHWFNFR